MKNFVIAQISDLHIPSEEINVYNVDVRKNFIKILNSLTKHQINMIVITGDLSYRNGEKQSYKWIKNYLDNTKIKYLLLPGNHDNSINLLNIFKLPAKIINKKLYYLYEIPNWKLLFLDSSDSTIEEEQLNWIEDQSQNTLKKIILFMHHPPCLSGCKYMDKKYSFKNIEQFQNSIRKFKNIKYIFCGHYHNENFISFPDFKIYITPSTWFQIDEKSDTFSIKSYKIGWRKIILYKDIIETEVIYLN